MSEDVNLPAPVDKDLERRLKNRHLRAHTEKFKRKWTPEVQQKFLDLYRVCGNITECCRELKISTATVRHYRTIDIEFDEAVIEAGRDFADLIEQEAIRRAVKGVQKPVIYQGEIQKDEQGNVITTTEYSDRLMETVLKAKKPNEYRERKEITGADGGPLNVTVKALADMDDDD